MEIKTILKQLLLLGSTVFATHLNAASIGNYTFADNAIADQLISGQGQFYNGSSWYFGADTSWQSFDDTSWQPASTPVETTDTSVSTFLAATNSTGSTQLEYGFSQSTTLNSNGSDLAFFFLWDQSNNDATVSINGISQSLIFTNVFDSFGTQQVANDVNWNGSILSNVQLMAGTVDLSDFGFSLGESLTSSIIIDMTSNGTNNPMALSLIAALDSTHVPTSPVVTSPVPLPGAFFLLLTGLSSFGLVFRRKKNLL